MSENINPRLREFLQLPNFTEGRILRTTTKRKSGPVSEALYIDRHKIVTYQAPLELHDASVLVLSTLAFLRSQPKRYPSDLSMDKHVATIAEELSNGVNPFPFRSSPTEIRQLLEHVDIFIQRASDFDRNISVHISKEILDKLFTGNGNQHNEFMRARNAANAWVIKNNR